jgi:hypothetical protein
MNIRLLIFLLLTINSLQSRAQDSIVQIKGQLIDIKSNEGIEYVNIGIRNTPIGCISKVDGHFILEIKSSNYLDSTIYMSAIGYESVSVKVAQAESEEHLIFYLNPITYELESATIVGGSLKTKSFGAKRGGDGLIKGMLHGLEKAFLVPVKKGSIKIKDLNFCLREGSDTVTFRVNFYEKGDSIPGNRIVEKNLIFRQKSKEDGWIRCELSDENLEFSSDFYIAVELLPNLRNDIETKSRFKAKLGGKSKLFTRDYLDSWEEIKGLGVLLNIDYYIFEK